MRIMYFNSDLSTQIMQYIFMRYREIVIGGEYLVDDTAFCFPQSSHTFELDKVFPNVKLKFLKDTLDKDVWDDIVATCVESNDLCRVPDVFLDSGIDITIVADESLTKAKTLGGEQYVFDGATITAHYDQLFRRKLNLVGLNNGSVVSENTENIYFMGRWLGQKFGLDIKDTIQQELVFPTLVDDQSLEYKNSIQSSQHSVAIIINKLDATIDEYARFIRKTRFDLIKNNLSPSFFIFSNDLDWCISNKSKLKFGLEDTVVFVQQNLANQLQLISFCDCIIASKQNCSAVACKIIASKEITLHLF